MELNLGLDLNTEREVENKVYDAIIVGAGSAGMTAAIYLKRKGRDILLLGEATGGQMMDTASIENYPGYTSIQGYELTEKMEDHTRSLDIQVSLKRISEINKKEYFELKSGDEILKAKTVIWATGARRRHLNVPGEEEFHGRGVAYCSICDAPFYKDRKVVIAGGGNSALEASMDLEKVAREVTIVTKNEITADKILLDQVLKLDKIDIITNSDILEIEGGRLVENIKIHERGSDKERNIAADGIFVEIGLIPNSEVVEDFVEVNGRKEIKTDPVGRTNVEGFFACGDVRESEFKQIVIAAGEGANAALAADDYLNREG